MDANDEIFQSLTCCVSSSTTTRALEAYVAKLIQDKIWWKRKTFFFPAKESERLEKAQLDLDAHFE